MDELIPFEKMSRQLQENRMTAKMSQLRARRTLSKKSNGKVIETPQKALPADYSISYPPARFVFLVIYCFIGFLFTELDNHGFLLYLFGLIVLIGFNLRIIYEVEIQDDSVVAVSLFKKYFIDFRSVAFVDDEHGYLNMKFYELSGANVRLKFLGFDKAFEIAMIEKYRRYKNEKLVKIAGNDAATLFDGAKKPVTVYLGSPHVLFIVSVILSLLDWYFDFQWLLPLIIVIWLILLASNYKLEFYENELKLVKPIYAKTIFYHDIVNITFEERTVNSIPNPVTVISTIEPSGHGDHYVIPYDGESYWYLYQVMRRKNKDALIY